MPYCAPMYILARFFLVLSLVGASVAVAAPELRYGVVLAGSTHVFWPAMIKGIKQASSDYSVKVVIRSPVDDDAQFVTSQAQIKILKWIQEMKVDAIVLAPMPVLKDKPPVKISVPVIFVDRDSKDFASIGLVSTDNYAAGRAAADSLRSILKKGSHVGVLRLSKDVVSTSERENGFVARAKELGYNVALDSYVGHGMREASVAAEKILSSYTGPLEAIFSPSEIVTMAVLRALEKTPTRKVALVGFDYREEFKKALLNGKMHALVAQDSYGMGYRVIKELFQSNSGKERLPKNIYVDFLVLNKANIATPDVQKALKQYQ